uniref:Integrase catalytic domain-containing protein n=1 Tax=Tanacetum cinerariifolium TaxID=118510 RepID=A0A6L2P4K1_TANCI|nr:hypothetical protein [Tanacetum cinerariifolium]
MPTWCHMFNFPLAGNARVWFDDLPKESIDRYDDLKEAFLENYLQLKNASKTLLKSIISSWEIRNPRRNSCGEEKWRPLIVNGRNHFHHEIARSREEAELQEGRLPEPTKKQIEEMLKAIKLSHLIKELKQSSGKDQAKAAKKGETSGEKDKTEGPMIIETEMGRHCVYRMYVDGGSFLEILYEHCFNRFRPEVAIHLEYPKQTIAIGFTLTEEGRKELYGLLRRNLDIFAWKPADMIGVPRHIAEHRLNIREGCLPVRQNKRGQAPERNKAICEEVEKLLEDVCRYQGLKQSMPQRWLSAIENRLEGRVPLRVPFQIFLDAYKGYHQIKMAEENEEKTAFITSQGVFCTFLGYKVDAGELRVCPDKVEAVLILSCPKCLKDVQKLNEKLASLNRFMSKSAKKSLPFFKTLKKCTKKSDFQWTAKAEMAFKQMKKWIAELPMLTALKEKEELIMYLAAAKEAISAVLMTERDKKQMHIYFVSRALQGLEVNYTPMEKLILASILSNPEVAGRLLKWRFELEDHDIHYRPRTSAKGQILTDFIVERLEDDPLDTPMEDKEELSDPCVLFTDGSSCIDSSGPGLIIRNPKGMEFTYALKFRFNATNNEAEYEALIAGLRIAEQIGIKNLQENVDSRLVANQVNRVYVEKELGMIKNLDKEKSIDEKEVLAVVEEEKRTWMTSIYEYLTKEILSEEKRKARAIRRKAGELHFTGDQRGVMQHACWSETRGGKSFKIRQKLTPITSPWPFCKWGIDIAGPFSKGPGKVKFLIVVTDYFTKWIEAKPVAAITGSQVKKFVWDNIVCRFGLTSEIIFDNMKQFRDNPFKDWANRSLGEGIKARLDERSKNWLKEISHVLWAHRTMIKSSNGETPFSLTCGAKAVIPVEIGMPTLRTTKVDMIKDNEALGVNLDLLEEKREQGEIQEAKSKSNMEKYYNAKVRSISFCPGDLVYRNNEVSRAEDRGKLGPKWEGSYEVTEALGKGAYKLRDCNGNTLS